MEPVQKFGKIRGYTGKNKPRPGESFREYRARIARSTRKNGNRASLHNNTVNLKADIEEEKAKIEKEKADKVAADKAAADKAKADKAAAKAEAAAAKAQAAADKATAKAQAAADKAAKEADDKAAAAAAEAADKAAKEAADKAAADAAKETADKATAEAAEAAAEATNKVVPVEPPVEPKVTAVEPEPETPKEPTRMPDPTNTLPAPVPAPAPVAEPVAEPAPAPVAVAEPVAAETSEDKYVSFGYATEQLDVALLFNLNLNKSGLRGAPGIKGIQDFDERFSKDDKIKEVMLKYWRNHNPLNPATASEPKDVLISKNNSEYKAPCSQADIDVLKRAFNFFKDYTNKALESQQKNTDKYEAHKLLNKRIDLYLKKLDKGANQPDCIKEEDLAKKVSDPNDLYFSVLPKFFYLLHKHAKENNPIEIGSLLKEYTELDKGAAEYIEELKHVGKFTGIDHDGISGAARSVKELYIILQELFPGIFSTNAPHTQAAVSDTFNMRDYLEGSMEFLGGDKDKVIRDLEQAHDNYKTGEIDSAKEDIKNAIIHISEHMKTLDDSSNGNEATLVDVLKFLSELSKSSKIDDEETKEAVSKFKLGENEQYLNDVIEKLKGLEAQKPCPEPDAESCKPFVDIAKKKLYKELLNKIQASLNVVLDRLGLKDTLKLTEEYDVNKSLEEQTDVMVLDEFINKGYDKFSQWKDMIEKGAATSAAEAVAVAAPEPEPVAVAAPESVAAPEPVAAQEPEPVAAPKPEPVAAQEPEPEPEPVALAEPQVEPERVPEPAPPAAAQELGRAPFRTGRPSQRPTIDYTQSRDLQRTLKTPTKAVKTGPRDWITPTAIPKGKSAWNTIRGGAVAFQPGNINSLVAEQLAWESAKREYENIEPQYQQLLPDLDESPLFKMAEPFQKYIDENAHTVVLEEATKRIHSMTQDEIDDVFSNDLGSMLSLVPLYKKALPNARYEWIPILVRADILRKYHPK